jgi:DNA polymerase-3 subunit chi
VLKGKVLQTGIYFVETKSQEQRNLLCVWVERLLESGMKIQVTTDSSSAAQHVDQLLWSFSQESFVPHHILASNTSSLNDMSPVVITVGQTRLEGSDALVCDGVVSLDFMKDFPIAIHFILLDDAERRQESRLLWLAARDDGMQLHHVPYSMRAKPPR